MTHRLPPRLLAACLIVGAVDGQEASAPLRFQSPLTVREVPLITGYLGERWQANRQGYLHGFDIGSQVRLIERRDHREWWWIGEQAGKWLESAVLSSAHSDPELHERAKSMLDRIVASQEPDGYLGVTARDLRTPAHPLRGMDPYELYFMMHGLLAGWEQWQDPQALEAARKLGDYFVNTIGEGKAEFWPSNLRPPENHHKILAGTSAIAGHSVHYSWEGTLLIDPMLRLAQATGDKRYSEWSKWVVSKIDTWSGWNSFSRLDEVAGGTLGIHELQPYVHSHTFHMNFLGFLRLYELTGDTSLLRKVQGAWDDVASRQMYITGGVSVAEHYESGSVKPITGHAVETCASMSWLQVTQFLLEMTGEPKYADAMEKLLWNHVFAAQAIDGDAYRYHTPPNGEKPGGYHRGPDCCNASGHRMVSLVPTFLYGKDGEGIFINQYAASSAAVSFAERGTLRLRQETSFPESPSVRLVIESAPAGAAAIRLRLPSWCAEPVLKLNGTPQTGLKPGSYHRLTRAWQAGDRIELDLPMQPRWVRADSQWNTESYRLPGGEIMHRSIDDGSTPWALQRGPLVYAVDTLWWNQPDRPTPPKVWEDLAIEPALADIREVSKPGRILGPAYEARFVDLAGKAVRLPMVPFTNLGQGCSRPAGGPGAPSWSYAIWFLDPLAPAFRKRLHLTEDDRLRLARAIDHIAIGNPDSENAHRVQGGHVGRFHERSYRAGREFSYRITVPTDRDAKLIVTYWGGDSGREFDLFADDHLIDTHKLENSRPGEFFEESSTLPHALVRDRTDASGQKVNSVTLRFKSRNGDDAGGVFGIRVE